MKKLNKLEEKLNIATDLISELSAVVEDIESDTLPELTEVSTESSPEDIKIFTIESLKSDFILVRNNVIKLINSGQRVLDAVSLVDVSDLKASQLQAISGLQSTLGNNLKMLISIYKEIADIETSRNKKSSKFDNSTPAAVNMGTNITNNNVIFGGSSSELLDLIKQNN